jgi:hypothetical protein
MSIFSCAENDPFKSYFALVEQKHFVDSVTKGRDRAANSPRSPQKRTLVPWEGDKPPTSVDFLKEVPTEGGDDEFVMLKAQLVALELQSAEEREAAEEIPLDGGDAELAMLKAQLAALELQSAVEREAAEEIPLDGGDAELAMLKAQLAALQQQAAEAEAAEEELLQASASLSAMSTSSGSSMDTADEVGEEEGERPVF